MILKMKIQKQVLDNITNITKNSLYCFFTIINFYSCQKTDTKISSQTNDINMDNRTEQILENQIRNGANQYVKEAGVAVPQQFGEDDIDAEVNVVNEILKNSAFKFPENDEFRSKIEIIFGRKIDQSSTKKYLYVNYLDKCNHEYSNYKNDGTDYFGTFIIKSNNFITDYFFLPELINYHSKYPKLVAIEKTMSTEKKDKDGNLLMIEKWSDLEKNPDQAYNLTQIRQKNIQTLVARNKYLFNDSKGDLAWLLANDKEFLKRLVISFGYDKENAINKMVLEELNKDYSNSSHNITEKLGEIFFVKDCEGKLKIREGLLKFVSENTSKDDDRFIYGLGNYLDYLFKEDHDNIFAEQPSKKFTIEEKAKIVAYVANIESPAFYKFKPLNSDKAWHNAGTSLYNITAAHPEILKIIEKNNYYGLQPLQQVIESDQFAEESPVVN